MAEEYRPHTLADFSPIRCTLTLSYAGHFSSQKEEEEEGTAGTGWNSVEQGTGETGYGWNRVRLEQGGTV